MTWNAVFEGIMTLLQNDASLVPGILGAKTVTNQRLYRSWPASQQFLRGYEPNQPSEGWLVVEEPQAMASLAQGQYTTNHEYLELVVHVYGTTFSLTHAVLDVLDSYFHFTVDQQRDITWGDRFLLFTRRYGQKDEYQQDIKLYSKAIQYRMDLVRVEDPL